MTSQKTGPRPARPASKVASIVTHCVYEIATGSWKVGDRLPTLREAERLWGVNHLTVLKAYRRVAELGLVRSEPRAGFFVAEHAGAGAQAEARAELEQVYARTARRFGELSPLGAFRYLARLAEVRARSAPECAFVECTAYQAEEHAAEVRDRLDFPCLGWTTDELAAVESPPGGLTTLLTTAFHATEVARHARRLGLRVRAVSIEFAPDLGRRIAAAPGRVTIFATTTALARNMARSAREVSGRRAGIAGRRSSAVQVSEDVRAALAEPGAAVVLSPTLWSALSPQVQRDDRILALDYRVVETAWPEITAVLGLPLLPA